MNLEERPSVVHLSTIEPTPVWDLVERYSTLDRLLRVTARLFRAADTFRRIKSESSPILRPEEIEKALLFWVRATQATHFAEEVGILSRNEALPRSNRLGRLTPFVDGEDSLLRVGGRLRHKNLEYDFKHPLVLPRKSALTSLVVDDAHRRTLHGGVQLVLATLRRRFWVIGGRAPVRSFILRCVPCTRQRGVLASQMMGQLPSMRTSPSSLKTLSALRGGLRRSLCHQGKIGKNKEDLQSILGDFRMLRHLCSPLGALV